VSRVLIAASAILLALVASLVPVHAADDPVNVFYAGSLTSLNENLVGPAFAAATGYSYQGKSAGSLAIANQIKGHVARPDVVEFADPTVNATLMGPANGNYVSWYFTYARSELVIGFDPRSKFARAFRQVQQHHLPWYRALLQHGLRLGRTDPNLDPKGYRALFMAGLAQRVYGLTNFKRTVFGSDLNTAQIFPEEVLVARMLTGQIDAGIFYLSEVRDLGIPYVKLPAQVNLGSTRLSRLYATQHFVTDKGVKITGAPILYTLTIPSTVKDVAGAQAFIRFVLGKRVRSISAQHGLLSMPVKATGDRSMVPAGLTSFIGK
jgi:molybdate/tungstate transport system substrate-binding protein